MMNGVIPPLLLFRALQCLGILTTLLFLSERIGEGNALVCRRR